MGDTSRKGGGAMQTQREQTNRGYTVQKVLAQGDMEFPEYIESAGKSLMHVDGQKTRRTWLSGTLFSSV